MTRSAQRRIEFTVSHEIGDAYDKARGDMKMATWIKRALESALRDTGASAEPHTPSASSRTPGDPAAVKAKREAPPDRRVKTSAEARPRVSVPKVGKR